MEELVRKVGRLGKKVQLHRIPGSRRLYKRVYRITSDKYTTPYTPNQWLQKDEYEIRELSVDDYILCLPPKYYKRWSMVDISNSDETEAISKIVNEGDIVTDIGGHLGRSLIPLHKSVSDSGKVIVFEPMPPWTYYLNHTVERNGLNNVVIENAVLGDKTGATKITIPEAETSQSSILTPDEIEEGKYSSGTSIEVDSVKLSDYLKENKIKNIDFGKIDIEGGEYNLICKTNTLDFIEKALIELHFSKIGEKKSDELIDKLSKQGELKTLSGTKLPREELSKMSTEDSRVHILWSSK